MKVIDITCDNKEWLIKRIIFYLDNLNIQYLIIKDDDQYEMHFSKYIFRIKNHEFIHNENIILYELIDLYKKHQEKKDASLLLNQLTKYNPNIESIKDEKSKINYSYQNNNHVLKLTKGKNRKINNINKQFRRKW